MIVRSGKPRDMSEQDRKDFIAFVLEAGEVDPNTLPDLVARAAALITLHDGETLVGTAAVKRPYNGHRRDIFELAGVSEHADAYPLELGWLHVRSDYRKGGRSHLLMARAIELAEGFGLYATTKTAAMHHILPAHGFHVLGSPYVSTLDPNTKVSLFCRNR